jgi:hypothetical protein
MRKNITVLGKNGSLLSQNAYKELFLLAEGRSTLNYFSRERAGQISIKFSTKHSWVKGIKVYVHLEGQVLFKKEIITKMQKYKNYISYKKSSQELQGQKN